MAVVKANGYGHGSVKVSKAALDSGADRLGVALVEEAFPLREAGITSPIQLLTGPPPGSAKKIEELDLIPAVFFKDHLEELKDIKVKVHLKVDTGMNRIGLRPEEIDSFLEEIKIYPNIEIEGLFTHFATADDPKSPLFSKQIDIIKDLKVKYKDVFKIIHCANSSSALFFPESHMDMVRIGISLYGLEPSKIKKSPVKLVPALSWLAKTTYVKKISGGESVSYGAKFITEKPVNIATIPVGYADGYSRKLTNKSKIIAKGNVLKQVGTVCMDQLMILDENGDIGVGDKVILLGNENGVSFTADDMANILDTINYEVVCTISSRVPRVYLNE